MHTHTLFFTTLASFLALSAANPLNLRSPSPAGGPQSPLTCDVCSPLSSQNKCDVSTSCINTGVSFHCACRAGFKTTTNEANTWDQFRINLPNYESLVFVPEKMACNTPCADPTAAPGQLCQEVKVQDCATSLNTRDAEPEWHQAQRRKEEAVAAKKREEGKKEEEAQKQRERRGCGKGKRWMVCTTPVPTDPEPTETTSQPESPATPTP